MKLIVNASTLWHRLWTVRFGLAGAAVSAAQVAWEAYATGQVPVVAICTGLLSLATAGARLVAQPEAHVDAAVSAEAKAEAAHG